MEDVTVTPTFPVVEIFGPTIQGEGACAGLRSHFVRFGYCDGLPTGHCRWCDSMHAVDPKLADSWERITAEQIVERVKALSPHCRTVTLSGGNPLLYDLTELVQMLQHDGYTVWVETQGTIYRPWVRDCHVTISPKPPSAGASDLDRLDAFIAARYRDLFEEPGPGSDCRTALKIPVDPGFDDGADLEFARSIFTQYAHDVAVWLEPYLSIVTYPSDEPQDVLLRWEQTIEWLKQADIPDVACLPQLHVLLWGHERGV